MAEVLEKAIRGTMTHAAATRAPANTVAARRARLRHGPGATRAKTITAKKARYPLMKWRATVIPMRAEAGQAKRGSFMARHEVAQAKGIAQDPSSCVHTSAPPIHM